MLFIHNPIKYFDNKSSLFKKIFNLLIWWGDRYQTIRPSQSRIATILSCSREQVNRIISQMEKDGLIKKTYRHLSSCVYVLSHWFGFYDIRNILKGFFSALKYPPLFSLFLNPIKPAVEAAGGKNVTQVTLCNKNYNNIQPEIYNLTTKKEEDSFSTKKIGEVLSGVILKGSSMKSISESVAPRGSVLKDFNFTPEEEEALLSLPKSALAYALKEYATNAILIPKPFNWLRKVAILYTHALLDVKSNIHHQEFNKGNKLPMYREYKSPSYPKINREEEKEKLRTVTNPNVFLKILLGNANHNRIS